MEWELALSGSARAPPTRVALVGAFGSVGTNLRCATAPPAPAEAGGALDGAGGRVVGGTTGAMSESAQVGCAMGRSEERVAQDEGTREEMAAEVNAEWGRLTASRRCEAYDGRASRKIFLKEMGETYGGGARLVGPVARVGPGSGVRSDEHPTLGLFLSLTP